MDNQSEHTENKENEEEPNQESLTALFTHCARIYEEIKKMDRFQLIDKLEYYGLDTKGNVTMLRKRLKSSYRRFKSSEIDVDIKNPVYPYYVIIDFEATCVEKNQRDYPHEIIEFPAVLLNSATLEVEDTFQMYCKPVINPKLSDFCVELTGITQDQVDSAENFRTVFGHFSNWLRKHNLMKKDMFAVVADTPWDMTRFLYQQCIYAGVSFPNWGKKWVNIKTFFQKFYKVSKRPIKKLLRFFDMEFEGRLHCGLDDAKNIARIVIRMIRDGANMAVNETIVIPRRRLQNDCNSLNSKGVTQVKRVDGGDDYNIYKQVEDQPVRAYYRALDNPERNSYKLKMRLREKIIQAMEREIMEKCRGEISIKADGPLEWLPKEQVKEYNNVILD